MIRLVVRRLLLSVPVLFGISVLVFVLVQISPGDPVAARMGADYDPRIADQMRRELGLDRPIPVQYVAWLGRALRGDLGRSLYIGQPDDHGAGDRHDATPDGSPGSHARRLSRHTN